LDPNTFGACLSLILEIHAEHHVQLDNANHRYPARETGSDIPRLNDLNAANAANQTMKLQQGLNVGEP
jgi:hypothetical protein